MLIKHVTRRHRMLIKIMRQSLCMKLLATILLFPFGSFAQDISGVWVGNMYNDTTRENIHYELAINESNGKEDGYSHTTFIINGIKNIGVKSVKIKMKDDRIFIMDEKFVYNNYSEPPAKGVKMFSDLILSENDSAEVLSGKWGTNATKTFRPLTGTLFLEKKKKVKPEETIIVAKLNELGLSDKLSFLSTGTAAKNILAINNKSVVSPVSSSTTNEEIKNQEANKAKGELSKAEQLKVQQQSEKETQLRAQKAKEDSLKAEQLKIQKLQEDLAKATQLKAQKAKEDSLRDEQIKAQKLQEDLAKAAQIKVQKAKKDSLKDEQIKARKLQEDLAKATQLKAQKAKEDSLKAEQLKIQKLQEDLAKAEQIKAQKAKEDSLRDEKLNAQKLQENLAKAAQLKMQNAMPQAAADIEKRKIETIRTVEISQDSLVFSLYDNGTVDGDTVSVLLNGKVIWPRVGLLERAINKTIYLTPEMGDTISIILYAENLGSIPPNTGLLVIREAKRIYEIRFSGDLNKNSGIILIRKKKE